MLIRNVFVLTENLISSEQSNIIVETKSYRLRAVFAAVFPFDYFLLFCQIFGKAEVVKRKQMLLLMLVALQNELVFYRGLEVFLRVIFDFLGIDY